MPDCSSPSVFHLEFDLANRRFEGPNPARLLPNYPHCELNTAGEPFALEPQTIRVTDVLYSGDRSTVYLGRCSTGLKTELALKFTNEDDVLAEAGAYDSSEALQGNVIPKLFGVLFGNMRRRGANMACLVLERFGSRIEGCFTDLDTLEKAKILDKLVVAHHAGLDPIDFAPRNVLVRDGDYRITDLGHAKPHLGPCRWTYGFVQHVGTKEYDDGEPKRGGCFEIWEAAVMMGFWNANKLRVCGSLFVDKSPDLPSQAEVDDLITDIGISFGTMYDEAQVEELAVRYYRAMKTRLMAGYSCERLRSLRLKVSYEVHKEWHIENDIPFEPLPPWEAAAAESEDEDSGSES
ncbi:hypothetical protein EIP91_003012 [Steccherinum ochraceum]|uniref:Protein kinase domain-containing protein n=1 Tax=Steccherinum ochraceum TaxID=92696 RepID=A0A4R0RDL0_9APHY|nr:hypothetical protein EIP91_003012 [Steccherinum ochraceum]